MNLLSPDEKKLLVCYKKMHAIDLHNIEVKQSFHQARAKTAEN